LNLRLSLVKNGVPFDVAFSLEDEHAMAYGIIFGQIEGGVWSWNAMAWERQK
jgi:hypothetical protein